MNATLINSLSLNSEHHPVTMDDMKDFILSLVPNSAKVYLLAAYMTSFSGLNALTATTRYKADKTNQQYELLSALKNKDLCSSSAKVKQMNRLNEITKNEKTIGSAWVDRRVADIAQDIIVNADDKSLERWLLFPDVNGSLSMEIKRGYGLIGNISIGIDGYSYFVQGQDRFLMKEDSEISIEDIVRFINEVAGL